MNIMVSSDPAAEKNDSPIEPESGGGGGASAGLGASSGGKGTEKKAADPFATDSHQHQKH